MSPSLSATWLASVDEAYRQMLAALGAARTSVRLEIYIFKPGEPGDLFREALVAAALRGVKVRVLLDGFGSRDLPPDYWRALEAAGGEAGVFNPLALDRLVIRNHRKLLVVDDETAFVGGFNIAPEYVGDGVTRGWRDLGSRSPARWSAASRRRSMRCGPIANFCIRAASACASRDCGAG
jgi:cardiolipin synthase